VYGGSRSARRNRAQGSGFARVAAQLAAPVALGLLIGGVLAYQAGSTNNAIQPVPLGAVPTPTASFGKPSSAATGAVAPPSPGWLTPPASLTPSAATGAAAPTATPAATTSNAGQQKATASASGR
jgi:hypothetical protein